MISIIAKENEKIEIDENLNSSIPNFNEVILAKKESPEILGLHFEKENDELVLKSSYFVGYAWLESRKSYINITPKKTKNDRIADFIKMFSDCINDSYVATHLDDTYKIFTKQPKIEIDKNDDLITPFIVINFINILHKIAKQGLKKGYIRETKNLSSKIKGRIFINQTIKSNHYKSKLEKTVCDYQKHTINCLENQILKTALIQSLKYLAFLDNEQLVSKMKNILHSFKLVETKEVFERDFTKIKLSSFFFDYKEALNLAKLIFNQLGYSLQTKRKEEKIKIPPFYINMPELFERYVEIQLRKTFSVNVIPGYSNASSDKNSYLWGLRPDFIIRNQNIIVDAKYKYWFVNPVSDNLKDDLQQLSLYGRIENLKNNIGTEKNNEPVILFVYPNTEKNNEKEIKIENSELIKGFTNIYKMGIEIPNKETVE
jgi:5-methylcytosine-specific restriction endonuclease McrBC regulatory subunit McrC